MPAITAALTKMPGILYGFLVWFRVAAVGGKGFVDVVKCLRDSRVTRKSIILGERTEQMFWMLSLLERDSFGEII